MIHPSTELKFINNEIGYGVVAKELIPKGTITWVLDDLDKEFTPEEIERLSDMHQYILDIYTYRNGKGNFVLCWDNARYVNHSFKSNCLTTAYDFEIAIRDIQPGEQLTDDYGYLNIPRPFRAVDEGTKRKTVFPDDLLRYHKIWDKKLIDAFRFIPQVKQPLKELISNDLWEKVEKISAGKREMASILNCYYAETTTSGNN
ncbi:MAG: SET domain-containing protein [Candidatus Cyclobacteriaceae bacterium M2_1C_046]